MNKQDEYVEIQPNSTFASVPYELVSVSKWKLFCMIIWGLFGDSCIVYRGIGHRLYAENKGKPVRCFAKRQDSLSEPFTEISNPKATAPVMEVT